VVVSDGQATDTETLTITVNEVNAAPALAAIGDKTVDEGDELAFTASATDGDVPANPLTYSLGSGPPTGAAITPAGAFSWTPSEGQGPGTYPITVSVSDGKLTDTETITIRVNEVNVAPALASIDDATVSEGQALTFTASATDVDLPANPLTYSLGSGAPAGASITPAGAFSWTPSSAQGPGTHDITVHVTDGALTDDESFTVTVIANQVISFPAIADRTYGDAPFAPGASVDSPLPVVYDTAGTCSMAAGKVVIAGAGTCTVTASQAGNEQYNAAESASRTFAIAKAPLRVNAEPKTKVYGQADPAFTWTYSGFVNGETAADGLSGVANCSRVAGTHVGSYDITCGPGDLTSTNYAFTTGTTGPLTITKATLNVDAQPKTKVYGQADPTSTWTYGGLVNGDTSPAGLTGAASCTRAAGNDVGSYEITCKPGNLAANDYRFVAGSTATLSITQANAAVSVGVTPSSSFGQFVLLTADVAPSPAGNGVATGTVTFKDGTATIGTATISNGRASIVVDSLAVGAHSITSTYNGDANVRAGTSAAAGHTVNKAATALTANKATKTLTTITFIAALRRSHDAAHLPGKTLTFVYGNKSCIAVTNSAGVASCSINGLSLFPGTYSVGFAGDGNYLASVAQGPV
jgi:hypothetical protein